MKSLSYCCFVFCLLWLGCSHKTNNSNCEKLVKVEITDSCFNNILTDYIKAFPFDGKGIYLATIKSSNDTIKYYVSTVFTEQDINTLLKKTPYYFYDIINQRVVIIDTKFEKHFEPKCVKYDCDTVLKKYYDYQNIGSHREVYLVEFTKFADTLTKRAVYFDPF
jgi:hypothetical protein